MYLSTQRQDLVSNGKIYGPVQRAADQQVARLDISMRDAAAVYHFQPLQDLPHHFPEDLQALSPSLMPMLLYLSL